MNDRDADGLGAAGTVMFIRQYENGYGNYTEEREAKHKDITLDEVVKRIYERKAKK
jgi:hypothetical protein